MGQKPYIITITGPESSGKTTLARQLADQYGCPWVPEYARQYLEGLGREYGEADLEAIAEGQMTSIRRQLTDNSVKPGTTFPSGPLKEMPGSSSVLMFQKSPFGDQPRQMLIIDSGMLSLHIWAKIKYGKSIPLVEEALREDMTSLYILCRPVLPWESDPLREAPGLLDRAWIYNHYLKEIMLTQAK